MNISSLKNVHLFTELGDDDLEKIEKVSRLRSFNRGDIIFFDTEPYLGFYVVLKGLVKIYKISKNGREHILHIMSPFDTFAEVPLFEKYGQASSNDSVYPANSMALEDETRVLLIPSKPFTELLEKSPGTCFRIISGLSKRLRHLNRHIEQISLKDVSKRLAGFILNEISRKKRNSDPENITLRISKNDLASYLGTIQETLSRSLKKLQDDNIIEVNGRTITINDLLKLKGIAS